MRRMCGRMALDCYIPELSERFEAEVESPGISWEPKYNIPPKTTLRFPIIVREHEKNLIRFAVWGLLPSSAPDETMRLKYETFNAKIETVSTSRVFSPSLQQNKFCLVPVSAFFEWFRKIKPSQPIMLSLKDERIMAFAGLWAPWMNQKGEVVFSFTIITQDSNAFVKRWHHRMPLMVPRSLEPLVLNSQIDPQEKLVKCQQFDSSALMTAAAVDRQYVNYGKEVPDCIRPIDIDLSKLETGS